MQKERVKVKRLAFAPTTKRSIDISEQRRGVEYWFHRLCNESHWPGSWLTGVRKYFTTADPNQNRDPFPPPSAESFPIVAQSPTSIPYKNALNDSRLSASITRVRKKPFEDPLKKGVRTFLWKHGMFFECNTSCSIILCLFVPFTDEKWRYFGR